VTIRNTSELFSALCDIYAGRGHDAVSVQIGREPKLTVRYSTPDLEGKRRSIKPIDIEPAAWTRWGRRATADWWAVTAPAVQTTIGTQEKVEGLLLVWSHYKVWEGDGIAIYHHAGPNRIYWMRHGLREWESISTSLHGAYAVVADRELSILEKSWVRDLITVTRPGTWRLPIGTQDSTTLTGTMALNDCLTDGVSRPLVDETATWLRQILPTYKVGAPSMEDVRLKLDLESRLRIEEKVVGSARPLAFTLQAIEGTTFPWPGLWLISGHADDFRTDFPVLLAWDATLTAVSAIARLHVDVKPGLVYGQVLSQSLLKSERRFSKRDVGPTEGAYSQVNPARIVGPAPVVASRLLQAASHELSHLVLHQLQPHSEIFTSRREQLFLNASDLVPALIDLVQRLGLDQRPSRTVPISPVTLDQWLHETLLDKPVASVSHLVQSWSAVRNLTEGRAQRDVEEALAALTETGRVFWRSGEAFVTNPELFQGS
jgi:hypothetical protein